MKKLLDINTWIALTVDTHSHHRRAREWYEAASLLPGDLILCPATEIGFVRLISQAVVMRQCGAEPLTNSAAIEFLANVYQNHAVSRELEPPGARLLWLQLAESTQASPNLWMDAYLAAIAISLNCELVTFDRGFSRFQAVGLKLILLQSP